MHAEIGSDTTATTRRFVFDGERTVEVFPCRCGKVHRSDIDYDIENYIHHNCFHPNLLSFSDWPGSAMCADCGEVFSMEEAA